ncbi:MAG: hypothetical protein JEZ12_05290 [Desulfobacterium sp.]|nr:hypothetical protein [Desulfobacterium sp.]
MQKSDKRKGFESGEAVLVVESDMTSLETKISKRDGRDLMQIKGDGYSLFAKASGDPLLPARVVNVLVPPGSVFGGIEAIEVNQKQERMVADIYPKQPQVHSSGDQKNKFVPLNTRIVTNKTPFPETPVEYVETARIRNSTFFVFRLRPVQFKPLSNGSDVNGEGALIINEKIRWRFLLKRGESTSANYPETAQSSTMKTYVNTIVINPEPDSFVAKTSTDAVTYTDDTCDYLIITSEDLVDEFQVLADHRKAMGVSAQVLSVGQILAQDPGLDSDQEKIKRCIKDYAVNRGTLWVLLGGDSNGVPDYDCYAAVPTGLNTSVSDATIPADIYYAGLDDMDWNDDNDGRACECVSNGDTIDLYPDLFIGRASVESGQDAVAFVSKVMAYERSAYDPFFHGSVLLAGAKLWNTWDGKSDAHWKTEYLWNQIHGDVAPAQVWQGTRYRFYDTGTDFAGGASYGVNAAHLTDQINSGYAMTFVATHGGANVWGLESGSQFSSYDVEDCVNLTTQGLIYTMACNTNKFDWSGGDSLSEAFIRSGTGGAVAYIGSSRYGWGYPSQSESNLGTSFQFARAFMEELFYGKELNSCEDEAPLAFAFKGRIGVVHASHKVSFASKAEYDGSVRWLEFALNLMGDPFMKVLVALPGDLDRDRDLDGSDLAASVQNGSPARAELWEMALRFGK